MSKAGTTSRVEFGRPEDPRGEDQTRRHPFGRQHFTHATGASAGRDVKSSWEAKWMILGGGTDAILLAFLPCGTHLKWRSSTEKLASRSHTCRTRRWASG